MPISYLLLTPQSFNTPRPHLTQSWCFCIFFHCENRRGRKTNSPSHHQICQPACVYTHTLCLPSCCEKRTLPAPKAPSSLICKPVLLQLSLFSLVLPLVHSHLPSEEMKCSHGPFLHLLWCFSTFLKALFPERAVGTCFLHLFHSSQLLNLL